jgi:hypothetical protein
MQDMLEVREYSVFLTHTNRIEADILHVEKLPLKSKIKAVVELIMCVKSRTFLFHNRKGLLARYRRSAEVRKTREKARTRSFSIHNTLYIIKHHSTQYIHH